MDERTCRKLTSSLNTFPENVVREEYEMIFLKILLESQWGKHIVFKGGTALRLAYQAVRFSEDLDFSLLKKINWSGLKTIIRKEANNFPTIKVKDLKEKHYTYFALMSIKEEFLKQPFLLKIEISKRPVKWKKDTDYQLKQLESPVTPLKASGFTVTRQRVYLDKKKAIKARIKGRDLYDLWYLSQFLNKPFSGVADHFKKRAIISELKRFLPKSNWWIVKELLAK